MGNVSDDWIDAVAVRDWMNAVVDLKEQEARLEKLGSHVQLVRREDVHIYEGIDTMASATGTELTAVTHEDAKYPFEYSLVYRGIRFFQLSEERIKEYENL